MQNVSPDAARLAARLRQLRQDSLDGRLTQANLARALSAEESLSSGTVSSWESESGPKMPRAVPATSLSSILHNATNKKEAASPSSATKQLLDEEKDKITKTQR
jgi:hypothetical protein